MANFAKLTHGKVIKSHAVGRPHVYTLAAQCNFNAGLLAHEQDLEVQLQENDMDGSHEDEPG